MPAIKLNITECKFMLVKKNDGTRLHLTIKTTEGRFFRHNFGFAPKDKRMPAFKKLVRDAGGIVQTEFWTEVQKTTTNLPKAATSVGVGFTDGTPMTKPVKR
jgi:hypothetical protein